MESVIAGRLPLVLFPDATQLEGPEDYTDLVAKRLGTRSQPRENESATVRLLGARAPGFVGGSEKRIGPPLFTEAETHQVCSRIASTIASQSTR